MTELEQSILDLLKTVKYGEVVIKVEDKVVTDLYVKHHHKPHEFDKTVEKV